MEPDIRHLLHFGTKWMEKYGMSSKLEIGFEEIESDSDYFAVFSGSKLHIVFNTGVIGKFESKDYEYILLREIKKFSSVRNNSQKKE